MKPTRISLCLNGLLLCASVAFAADIPQYPFVFTTGKADVDTPPDIATCSLTIHAIDPDAGKAESTVNGRLKEILATLTKRGIASGDIESFSVNKQILSTAYTEKEPAEIRGYDLTRNLTFKARQLKPLPEIEAAFIGAPNVEQINCQFDRADRQVMEADLLGKALRSAKEQAEKLAAPLGRRVTSAEAISRVPFDSIPDALGLGSGASTSERMFSRSVAADELLVPSTIHLSVSVNVLFKME